MKKKPIRLEYDDYLRPLVSTDFGIYRIFAVKIALVKVISKIEKRNGKT